MFQRAVRTEHVEAKRPRAEYRRKHIIHGVAVHGNGVVEQLNKDARDISSLLHGRVLVDGDDATATVTAGAGDWPLVLRMRLGNVDGNNIHPIAILLA